MALLPNSSLHSWISFNETTWNNVSFRPCQYVNWTLPNVDESVNNSWRPIIIDASCTQVCNNSGSLFYRQDNLATCGIWSTLAYKYNSEGSSPDPNRFIEKAPEHLLNSFADVGLDAYDPEYFESAVSYADVMSACFAYLYQNVKTLKSANDGLVPGACTKNELFPYWSGFNVSVRDWFHLSTTALETCLVDICSPVALNPEFAGVGFVISFILQSTIAIVAFAILLGLEYLHWSTEVTLAALTSFHKAQCYFASTVQISTLILLFGTDDSNTILIDTSALVVLVTSGFIPVTFGLASITRFGRPSLHLVMLSFITFVLATGTLFALFGGDKGLYYDFDDYPDSLQNDYYLGYGTCAIGGQVGGTLFPLCGSSLLNNNYISSSIVDKWWVWVAWAICMVWIIICLLPIITMVISPEKVRLTLDSTLARYSSMNLLKKIMDRLNGRMLIFVITPMLCFGVCFGVQLYLIVLFNSHHLVSQDWSFGQVIAVAVWLPSIFEYCLGVLESEGFAELLKRVLSYLKPKYTSLLRATREMVRQTATMTKNIRIGRSNHAASSGSDPEPIPLQSVISAVDSHGTVPDQQQEIVIEDSVRPA